MSYCQNAVESLLLTWQWDENPNQEVINTLNLLCGEVPYLGEACSVVELLPWLMMVALHTAGSSV